jgi:hypothetical protein
LDQAEELTTDKIIIMLDSGKFGTGIQVRRRNLKPLKAEKSMKFRSIIIVLATLMLIAGVGVAADTSSNPVDLLNQYIEALKASDWSTAERCWVASDIESSHRLGIKYIDVPVKYDCASVLTKYIDQIRDGGVKVIIGEPVDGEGWTKIPVKLSTANDSATTIYYAVKTPEGWRLSAPAHVLTQGWKKYQSKYADIYYTDDSRINDYAGRALDDFIESAGSELGLAPDDMKKLADNRIEYYLCDENQIREITGFDIHGMVDLPVDAVITRHLPHKHELTHFLINYSLRNLSLYTAPFMQEGTACYLGGRWEKSPAIISYAGYAILKFELAAPEDILTFSDFHYTVGSADISYPVSALFAGYLTGLMSPEDFRQLYLDLSGDLSDIQSWSRERIQTTLEKACGRSWDEIRDSFNVYWPPMGTTAITPESDIAGDSIIDMDDEQGRLIVTDDGAAVHFRIVLANGQDRGFVLMTDPDQEVNADYKSDLFMQQLPNHRYDGYRYGIRFTPDEIAFYDYYTNELVADYIRSFSEDPERFGETAHDAGAEACLIRISKSILDSAFISGADFRLIGM